MHPTIKKTLIASSLVMAFGAPSAYAAGMNDIYGDASYTTNHANFTMLTAGGGTVGGTNNVVMTWDGDAFNASSDYTGPGSYSNVTAASTTPFFGTTVAHTWTAHDIQVFVPGSYTFDVTLGGGNPEGTGVNAGAQFLNVTVPTGSIGMHMLFDWNGNLNIDVFVVANPSSVFGAGLVRSTQTGLTPSSGAYNKCDAGEVINCLWDGATNVPGFKPTTNQVWMLASSDGNGDGVMGINMAAGGPFAGFNANFNANMDPIADISDIGGPAPVPVPAAVWLFGSGLLGLVGISRRKGKKA
ncbi:MAG: hypothetical protein ACYC1T_04120 [Sulfuricaulis sp.]